MGTFVCKFYKIWGPRIAPNGIFVITKNVGKLSGKNFYFKKFFMEPIEREIGPFLRKGVDRGSSGEEEIKKIAPWLIFFQIAPSLEINYQISFYILSESVR